MVSQKNPDQNTQQLSGFALQWVQFFREGEVHEIKMLLPSNVETNNYIGALKENALVQMRQSAVLVNEERARANEITRKRGLATGPDPMPMTPSSMKGTLDVAAERESLNNRQLSDSALASKDCVPVYQWDEPLKLLENKAATPDSDVHKRNAEIFKQLKAKGHMRSVARPEDQKEALSRLDQLRQEQPHFCAVIDLVWQQMALATARRQPLQLPPILLNGDPGVGKTFFTQTLATVLNAPIRRHAFDSATTESALTGSDKHWGNTTYGLVFEMVCLGNTANPIILLDELDKSSRGYNRNPLAPLHTLLEPITASRVTDISVGLTFDASHVMWIATANNPSRIPASMRSRFIEFDIQLPTGAHALQVAAAVAESIYIEIGLSDFEPVSTGIVKLIAHLVPREQGQALRRAFASAIANQRTSVQRQDVPPEILLADDEIQTGTDKSTVNRPAYLH